MKLSEILKGMDVVGVFADTGMEITGVYSDSRKVSGGGLFVAVRGYESDGHKFIASAAANGAACVICEEKPETDIPYVLVENSRLALAEASVNWYGDPTSELKVIGVTGTNGKTTTTTLVKQIIERCAGAKVGLIGTNGNMIGDVELPAERTTPESNELQALFRQMADAGCTYVVMEVSSHALYLDRVWGTKFEIGLFTNLTEDHLDFHKTMEEYGKAKAILFSRCRKGIVNGDDPASKLMRDSATCPVYEFSAKSDAADLTAKNIHLKPDGVYFDALTTGKLEKAFLGIPGMFSVYNALAALSAALNLGFGMTESCEALRASHGVKGRAEIVPTGRDFTVIIDYAHTPDALENIIKTVKGFAKGRVVTLFGCGGDRDRTKRPIMGEIAVRLSDHVIVTSDNPRTEVPGDIIRDILKGVEGTSTPYTVIENRREAIGWAIKNAEPDDVVILAGKGHETYQVIGKEKRHFDEREIAAEFLAEC